MTVDENIPFLDLITPHVQLEGELTSVVRRAFATGAFIGGPMVAEFEKHFAEFCHTSHAVGVGSGTDALRFALIACGIKPGDVVVTVPNTFIATCEAISQAGAIPEFVDVDPVTHNLSVEKLAEFLEKDCLRYQTGKLVSRRHGRPLAAVVPVHLFGQMADMDGILALAGKYGLAVIEDACQAHGAEYFSRQEMRWQRAGSVGRTAAFSFYPGKNLGACGEGGAVTTNDPQIADAVKRLRDHGQAKKYLHQVEGYNGRLDAIQAGLLQVKLPHLEEWNRERRDHAAEYNFLLGDLPRVICPQEPWWSRGVYHLYVIRVDDRDGLIRHCSEAGIGIGIHYPLPLHLQPAYVHLGYKRGDFPVAERAAAEILSLPMFPQLTPAQQKRVAAAIGQFVAEPLRAAPQADGKAAVAAEPAA